MLSKIDKPGLIIIKTPRNPKKIAIHVLALTFSLRKIADNPTTITGVSDPMLCASANVKYLNDKTKQMQERSRKSLGGVDGASSPKKRKK